jgi:hypothetical protein
VGSGDVGFDFSKRFEDGCEEVYKVDGVVI